MDITPKKWPVSKVVAIALMVFAFIMLNANWLKINNELLESVDDLREEYEEEMEWIEEEYSDDIDEFLEDEGYSQKEVKAMKKALNATEDLIETMGKGKYSVWSVVSIMSYCSDTKGLLADDDSDFYNDELAESLNMIMLVCGIIVGVFALTGLFMILTIISHIKDKKSLGIVATILSIILFVIFGLMGIGLMTSYEDCGITLAPILTAVCAIASCIAWGVARGQLANKE